MNIQFYFLFPEPKRPFSFICGFKMSNYVFIKEQLDTQKRNHFFNSGMALQHSPPWWGESDFQGGHSVGSGSRRSLQNLFFPLLFPGLGILLWYRSSQWHSPFCKTRAGRCQDRVGSCPSDKRESRQTSPTLYPLFCRRFCFVLLVFLFLFL